MNRRTFLATSSAGIAFGLAGCQDVLGRSDGPDQPETTPTDDGNGNAADSLRLVGIYGNDVERDFVNGEYIHMKNVGADPLDVSGHVVEYTTGYTHQIVDLVLDPGAQLGLMSRDGENSVYQMSPPFYVRYLGADSAPLLGENGSVRVRDPEDDLIAAVSYEDFGCDGGTETGDEMECIHSD